MTNKMLSTKIAEPYAYALIDLAISTDTLQFITDDVNNLMQIFEENITLREYLINPLYPKSSKKQVLEKIIASQTFNQNTIRFIMILVERSRIGLFQAIAEKYLQLTFKFVKIELAQVTSAFKLTGEQEKEIIEQLKKRTGASEIRLVTNVDKALLGGLKLQIGSTVIDLSLKGQLKQLASQLETSLF